MIEQRDSAVRVRVRVQPRASRTEVAGGYDGALKVSVAAPPVDGAANDELVRFIARRVGVAQSRIRIVSGEVGRSKVLEIEALMSILFVERFSIDESFAHCGAGHIPAFVLLTGG